MCNDDQMFSPIDKTRTKNIFENILHFSTYEYWVGDSRFVKVEICNKRR